MKQNIFNIHYKIFIPFMAIILCMQAARTKNFESLNQNPDATSTLTPAYVFTLSQYNGAAELQTLLEGTMQYTTSYNDVAGFGSKYVASQYASSYTAFNQSYPNEINQINSVLKTMRADSVSYASEIAMAKIWRVYCFSKITDLYGDVPYSQASGGYYSGNYSPAYDTQKSIYLSMLSDLKDAVAELTTNSSRFAAADLLYGGNAMQWKKFGNSLMLRLGMRLTKVDATLAEQWVKEAVGGSLITSASDIAQITDYVSAGQDINKNPFAFKIYNSDYLYADGLSNPEGGKFQAVFIDHMKSYHDPRLKVLSVVYMNGVADTAVAVQKGMSSALSSKPSDFVTYSEPSQNTLVKLDGPYQIMGNAEVSFLLADAALKGWYSGDAKALYENGIRAAMNRWASFGASSAVASSEIDSYISEHDFTSAESLNDKENKIYTELWVELITDPVESFSSYRRTGYPELVPNNYPGNATGGKIFRRMLYPITEQNLNTENYNAAIADQGSDDFMTRVWWDTEN